MNEIMWAMMVVRIRKLLEMILVTGGAGYIGSHFVHRYLTAAHEEVIVLDNLSEGHIESLPKQGAIFFQGDVGDQALLNTIFQKHNVTAVVHFAANAYVGDSQQFPFKYWQNNVVQSINLFEAMERSGVRKLVLSSTCATYGDPVYLPLDEEHTQKPVSVYGMTKLALEKVLASLVDSVGWSFVSLRYFNAAGADNSASIGESHDPEPHLLPLVLKAALQGDRSVSIFGDDYDTPDGTCIRDYIHVSDLAEAHCQALGLFNERSISEYINLGTAHGASVKEVINACQEVTKRSIPVDVRGRRPGDPPIMVANSDKATRLLGWRPTHDLNSIIASAWHWEQNRRY